MTTLLIADPWDIHARSVAWGLEKLGESSRVWYTHDFPQKHAANIEIDNATLTGQPNIELYCARNQQPFKAEDIDAIWLRRWYRPAASSELHPADAHFAQAEANEYVRAVIELLNEGERFWINPLEAKRCADRKPVQLVQARAVGMSIPDTLLSNDPQRIREFFKSHGGRVIYKPYLPATWNADGRLYSTFTSPLQESLLEHDGSLSQAPGIYQSMVEKQYELRVTVMGRSIFASRIDSQQPGYYLADWRANISEHRFHCKRHELPPQIEQQCFDLLDRMGLVFGCIDLVVTPDDEHVFLEVNEMGQFLWQETEDAALPLLDCFVKFLHSRDPRFRYKPGEPICSLSEFQASPAAKNAPPEDAPQHVPLPHSFLMQE